MYNESISWPKLYEECSRYTSQLLPISSTSAVHSEGFRKTPVSFYQGSKAAINELKIDGLTVKTIQVVFIIHRDQPNSNVIYIRSTEDTMCYSYV